MPYRNRNRKNSTINTRVKKKGFKTSKKKGGFFGISNGRNSLKEQGKNVTFAAKLAAFVLENHKGDKVEFGIDGGFANGQKYIFGILPFLHVNITKNQFIDMLRKGASVQADFLTEICNNNIATQNIAEKVGFKCGPQSNTGVNVGVINSVISNINSNSKWASREKGRNILSQIRKNMRIQARKGLITKASLLWSKNFK